MISKAGAVGLMQLIPETTIRHGVRNLYDARNNIGGPRHLLYFLDRSHGNIRLALAAYNAGEKKVDRYRQISQFKETQPSEEGHGLLSGLSVPGAGLSCHYEWCGILNSTIIWIQKIDR